MFWIGVQDLTVFVLFPRVLLEAVRLIASVVKYVTDIIRTSPKRAVRPSDHISHIWTRDLADLKRYYLRSLPFSYNSYIYKVRVGVVLAMQPLFCVRLSRSTVPNTPIWTLPAWWTRVRARTILPTSQREWRDDPRAQSQTFAPNSSQKNRPIINIFLCNSMILADFSE